MIKVVRKIHHFLLILLTAIALVGVNVIQLYCAGCDGLYLRVQVVPEEVEASPCRNACEDEDCHCPEQHGQQQEHGDARHRFYRIADNFQVERGNIPVVMFFYLPDQLMADSVLYSVHVPEFIDVKQKHEFGSPPLPELLCTYLC